MPPSSPGPLPEAKAEKPEPRPVFLEELLDLYEVEIAALLADGFRNREIAEKLGTTEPMIKNRLNLVYEKLEITTGNKSVILAGRFFAESLQKQAVGDEVVVKDQPNQKLSDILKETNLLLVAGYVADGLDNEAIAQAMGMDVHDIKSFVRKIFDKMGFSRRIELALRVQYERFYR